MDITLDIDIEKFRYSLIGNGFLKEEVVNMSIDELADILKRMIHNKISSDFNKAKRIGLYD